MFIKNYYIRWECETPEFLDLVLPIRGSVGDASGGFLGLAKRKSRLEIIQQIYTYIYLILKLSLHPM